MTYHQDRTTVRDRREHLRYKLRTLVFEVRMLKSEHNSNQRRMRFGTLEIETQKHIPEVRDAARSVSLALGFIRGTSYERMENGPGQKSVSPRPKKLGLINPPDWKEIIRLVKTYGPPGFDLATLPQDAQAHYTKQRSAASEASSAAVPPVEQKETVAL